MKTLIKSIIYCQTVPLDIYCENCMSDFSAFVLYFSKSGNILFRWLPKKEKLSFQLTIIAIGRRDKSLVHELRVMAAVELHVNATYYAQQHPVLESFYGKDQSVISGKLFSSYKTVLSRGSSWDSKTNDSNCFYEALVQKEAFTIICKDRIFA